MIELRHVEKRLGTFHLRDIKLSVENGEYFILLGATGTGKTVLLETIAGMHKLDRGDMLYNGEDLTPLSPEERGVGFVYQDYALFPHLTLAQNIAFGLRLREKDKGRRRDEVHEIAALFGIDHLLGRRPASLSGGEQQRAAIARALIVKPRILLLDEPLSALDPRSKESFRRELRRVHELLRPTVIHVTHDFNIAFGLADRIAVMHDGTVVQVGTPAEVFRHPTSQAVAEFVGMENILLGTVRRGEVHLGEGLVLSAVLDGRSAGEVSVAVRPEDVLLSREALDSSARNSFRGRMIHITHEGVMTRVTVDVGVPLVSLITTRSLEEYGLRVGDEIWATFKSASVHVI
ncbi:MAG: ATP-binding cassette domain-containing protein [Thermoleophilia bacterium]|nr:ATP-binding cassette domain-containing protein [Thermoleophilia bacterium]